MTEEAQPGGVERAADGTPERPAEHEPRYHEPSYTLPPAAPQMPWVSGPGQPAGPASQWARPAEPAGPQPGPGESAPDGSASVPADSAAPSATSGAVPVAGSAPVAGPAPVLAVTGAADPSATELRVAAPGVPPASAAGYPGTSGLPGGAAAAGGTPPARVPAPPRESLRAPTRVDPVPGTPFGLVYLDVAPVTSGPAVAALVAGGGSVLVAFTAGCLGLAGSPEDWGGWVAGAFAVLAGLLGLAGLLLGELGRRQTGPARLPSWFSRQAAAGTGPAGAPPVRFSGRGLAIAGITCSAVGLAVTVVALAVSVLLQLA